MVGYCGVPGFLVARELVCDEEFHIVGEKGKDVSEAGRVTEGTEVGHPQTSLGRGIGRDFHFEFVHICYFHPLQGHVTTETVSFLGGLQLV